MIRVRRKDQRVKVKEEWIGDRNEVVSQKSGRT